MVDQIYTLDQVNQHNSTDDCWMVIDSQVYDLDSYLSDHLRFLNISSWCGQDASYDYHSKVGRNKDHSIQADAMLAEYLIGTLDGVNDLSSETTISTTKQVENTNLAQLSSKITGYNVWLPVVLTVFTCLLSNKFFSKARHNFIWNTILLLGLFPSFVIGILMAMNLISKEWLFFHVEFSIVFGTAALMHLLLRLKIYLSQGKMSFKKSKF